MSIELEYRKHGGFAMDWQLIIPIIFQIYAPKSDSAFVKIQF